MLGIAVTAAGGAMLAYGIPNNGFDVGNALIIAGTTAVAGGLIIVGLSAAVRELAHMTRMLDLRMPGRAAAPVVAQDRGREAPAEAAGATEAAEAKTPPAGDLSQVLAEPPVDLAATQPGAPAGDPFAPSRGNGQRRDALRERGFDAVWAPPSAPKPGAAQPPTPTPASAPKAGEAPADQVRTPSEPVAIRPSREPQAVTILKSGVIEGMAYTLYSDGSIEADLPQGMARFSSIDALRRHLGEQG
ncbi:MAG TPA: hypothetical protein VEM36_06910 [Xanthobacteraceae bacterium]|nr:hypothetical protein [Xanthobacteraceae bacterium]